MIPIHPRLRLWLEVGGLLADAAEAGAKQLQKGLKPVRRGAFKSRQPGLETPLWNECAVMLRQELKPFGAKVRLARYLGIPKQRLTDYLKGCRRLPDAEMTLRMLNWLAQKKAGRDLSL